MYDLPENPTARDIIQRSIVCHPSLFREMLIKQADMHDDYAKVTSDIRAKQGAIASMNACFFAYDAIDNDDVDAIVSRCGPMVIALNVACKLQCIPNHIRTAAAIAS